MRAESAVTEYVIFSGPEVHDYLVTVRSQLRAYLSAAFPDLTFSLVSQEGEAMGFWVVPVVGTVGAVEVEQMEPDYALLAEIKAALEAFRPRTDTLH